MAWGCVTQMAATPTVQTVSRWAGWQGAALRGTLSPLPVPSRHCLVTLPPRALELPPVHLILIPF